VLVRVRLGDGRQDALARKASRQAKGALNDANGADASGGERGVRPLLERGAHPRTPAHQSIDVRLLTRRRLGFAGAGGKHAGRDPGVHHDERVAVEDAHQVGVPAHAESPPEQRERHRVERPGDFDVAVGVDRALAAGEVRKRLDGEGLQRPLLDLDKVRPDLASRGAVDAQPRDRAIPVAQKRILRVEAVEATALERIVFDVATAALLLPVLLRAARCVGSGVKPQCAANAR